MGYKTGSFHRIRKEEQGREKQKMNKEQGPKARAKN